MINNPVPIAINKGSHQTLERERERERVCSNGPGSEELEELGESADNRGRFQGSNKKDGVVAVIVDVDFVVYCEMEWLPAPALTSSISEYQWNGMTLFTMRWLLLTCYMSNSTFIFLGNVNKHFALLVKISLYKSHLINKIKKLLKELSKW